MAALPTRCPSCGAQVELLRLNLSESMLACCGADCIWPLDEDDTDAFVVGAPQAPPAELFGDAAAGPRQKKKKQKQKRKRHRDEPVAPAAAAQPARAAPYLPQPLPAAAVDGRASPAASPIRSPEFAAAQEWRATTSLNEPPLKASEDLGSGSMMAPSAPSADDGLVLSPQLTAHKAPDKDSGAAGGIDLQGALDELDALLEFEGSDEESAL